MPQRFLNAPYDEYRLILLLRTRAQPDSLRLVLCRHPRLRQLPRDCRRSPCPFGVSESDNLTLPCMEYQILDYIIPRRYPIPDEALGCADYYRLDEGSRRSLILNRDKRREGGCSHVMRSGGSTSVGRREMR